LWPFVVNFFYH